MSENLEKMRLIYRKDDKHDTMNSAMIDCEVYLVDYGKFIHFKRFTCFSYTDFTGGGLSILYLDKETDMFFHAVVNRNHVMIYPSNNKTYKPQVFVDFFEQVKKSIDKNAILMTYGEYREKHKS